MNRKKIVGGRILTPMRFLDAHEVCISEGKIVHIGPRDQSTDSGSALYSAEGLCVAPGFIDIHVHGGGGHDFMDAGAHAFHGAAFMHALHGATTIVPTSVASPLDELLDVIDAYHRAVGKTWEGANMPGLHLEGPYFSLAQAGAQDPSYITPPVRGEYERVLSAGKGRILRWSSAPELPGAMEFSRYLASNGVVSAIGHSDAEADIVAEAVENGYAHVTHLYSGTSTIVRRSSYRFPGVVESAYLYPELTVEIIADGCHLPASLLTLVYRSFGPARVALVTDALRGAGMPEGQSLLGSLKKGRPCIIEDGVAKLPDRTAFAGSVATADRLVRNMVRLAGAPLMDAVKMMTMTPARIMGFRTKGRIAPGCDADLVFLDEEISAVRTMVGGEFIGS